MVLLLDKVSVSQWQGELRHAQVRLVIVHLHGQGDAKPVNYGTKINFLSSINYGAVETGTGLRRREIPLEEEPDKRRGEVDLLADAKGLHVHFC